MNTKLSERGSAELFVALFICAIVVMGMALQAHNGQDIFTAIWNWLASLGA